MAKREFGHPNEMQKFVGQRLGSAYWVEVTQERINRFADATAIINGSMSTSSARRRTCRAARRSPTAFLTLSLIPMLSQQISHINNVRNGINYGCNKVRFTSPVPGPAPRGAPYQLLAADSMDGAACDSPIRLPSRSRDRSVRACVAETMSMSTQVGEARC